MIRNSQVFLIIFFIYICYSCRENHFHGVGELKTELRQLEQFDTLFISGNVSLKVVFEPIDKPYVVITGGANLIQHLQTVVKNRKLTIRQNSRLNWLRSYKKSKIEAILYTNYFSSMVYNTFTPIEFANHLEWSKFKIELKNGMGQLNLKLQTDTFELILHNGSPDIFVEGRTQFSYVYSNGHGKIDLRNFTSRYASVHSRMTASIYLSVSEQLGATIEYLGNVYYIGNPVILWLVESHKGRLISLN